MSSRRIPASPASPGASPRRVFELRRSRALHAAITGWLTAASLGCLGALALPLAVRLLCAVAVWVLGLPGLRAAIALAAPGSVRLIEHRAAHHWRVLVGHRAPAAGESPPFARSGRGLRVCPSPHCLALGPVVWLRLERRGRHFSACVVDRRLASHLRLDAPRGRGGAANC
ncbi:MAG: hypothetical protein AMXMBFR37_08080 [Steroidobacteraceae bacterium]|nr:hypothetical protein [Steroidobacteraceae bacterium]